MVSNDAQKIMDDYEEFIYIISHDMKGPLRHLSEFSELLLESLGDNLTEDQFAYRKYMMQAVKKLSAMQNELLTLSRVTTAVIKPVNIRLCDRLQCLKDQFYPELQVKGDDVTCVTDVVMFDDVMNRLIKNAYQYQDRRDLAEVYVTLSRHEKGITIDVTDNGIGIDEQHYEDIFKMFRRLHLDHEYDGGIGAGLTITKKEVERLGGGICVKSLKSCGSNFTVMLPLSLA